MRSKLFLLFFLSTSYPEYIFVLKREIVHCSVRKHKCLNGHVWIISVIGFFKVAKLENFVQFILGSIQFKAHLLYQHHN